MPGLLALGLRGTELTEDALAHVVAENPDLSWLDLGGNRRVRRVDLTAFRSLVALDLAGLEAESVIVPPSVRSLVVSHARRLAPPDLSSAVRLVDLDLSNTGYADTVLASLPLRVPLRRVQLDRSGVTGLGLAALARVAPNVEELNLEAARIDDDDLEHVRAFTGLRKLSLRQTPITDSGLALLEGLPLEVLDTSYTLVGVPRGAGKGNEVIAHGSIREAFYGEAS
jgi:hypothetical protein